MRSEAERILGVRRLVAGQKESKVGEKKLDIVVLVGSLRTGSFSRRMAENLIEVAPESLNLRIVEIGDLPMYNPDLDSVNHPE